MNVFWLLYGDRTIASSRLQGYLIHDGIRDMARADLTSRIVYSPPFIERDLPWHPSASKCLARAARGGVVVLQKVSGPCTSQLLRTLSKAGIPTVYVHCDYEPSVNEPLKCDAVICPSEEMVDMYRDRGARRVVLIPDPAEFSWPAPAPIHDRTHNLRLGWVGNAVNWVTLNIVREILCEKEFRDLDLVTISDHPNANIPWSLESVRRELPTFDLAVLPTVSGDTFRVKSSNRAVLFMAAGVPVVAGRMRSYENLIDHGRNGLIASSHDDFRTAFRLLRDPAVRARIGGSGYLHSQNEYRLENIVARWVELLESVVYDKAEVRSMRQQNSRYAMNQVASHSALRLAGICCQRHRPDHAWLQLVRGLSLGASAPSLLLFRDIAYLARRATRSLGRRVFRAVVPLNFTAK